MASFFMPTKFVWHFGGHQVHLCGSFTRWVETVPMAPVDGQPGLFAVVVHLPPGYHQYKFIVDGEWRHDETQPFMPDPLGNVNNWLFVRRPDTATSGVVLHNNQATPTNVELHQAPVSGATAAVAGAYSSPPPHASTALASPLPVPADVDMAAAGGEGGVLPPIAVLSEEPGFTRKKVHDFLCAHTAYELIPESGKVVLLDVELPVRQAFHALHEQGIGSAPLWDPKQGRAVGMISASDFIHILRKLRVSISSGGNLMSEHEMDAHTIRALRDEGSSEGRPARGLVFSRPNDTLATVVQRLASNKCSVAPIMNSDPESPHDAHVLHLATISGVLACLMRHFRASVSSLPLLSQPIGSLPLGTWSPDSSVVQLEGTQPHEGRHRPLARRVQPLHCVQLTTPLTTALQLLLDAGVSALPVVDESGTLQDMYARSDISMLAKGNSYNRLQWEDLTVGQALSLASAEWSTGSDRQYNVHGTAAQRQQRVFMCSLQDPLRVVVERLSVPGVRRLFAVDNDTRRVEGIVSLSDVAAFLLM